MCEACSCLCARTCMHLELFSDFNKINLVVNGRRRRAASWADNKHVRQRIASLKFDFTLQGLCVCVAFDYTLLHFYLFSISFILINVTQVLCGDESICLQVFTSESNVEFTADWGLVSNT